MKQAFAQIHIDLVELWRMEVWGQVQGDLKTLDYAIGMIQEDVGLLNKKNNHHRKEIDNVSSEWKTLFKIIGWLETCIDKLETTVDTQKHNIARLKRNVEQLDRNVYCCCEQLLSPEPHGLMDKEGLEYSIDSEYQDVLVAPVNPPWMVYSPPPPTSPPSNLDKFSCPNSLFTPEGWATGFGDDVALDYLIDSKGEDVSPLLENLDLIPIVVHQTGLWVGYMEVDFIPFKVHGQCCKQSKGIPKSTYPPYCNCVVKG